MNRMIYYKDNIQSRRTVNNTVDKAYIRLDVQPYNLDDVK